MKHKVTKLVLSTLPDGTTLIRYTLQTKDHWYSRWKFHMDGSMPTLFSKEQLKNLGFSI